MTNPITTYRFQFNNTFTLRHLEKLLPYLERLGVGTIYASPILESTPGSTHGYDGVNPAQIGPEIGTLEELRTLAEKLRETGMGWLQDIVPNHMAFHQENLWLMDVLEHGHLSRYAQFFDTALGSDLFEGKLMVPFLGDDPEKLIAAGDMKVIMEKGRFYFAFPGMQTPLSPESYLDILNHNPSGSPESVSELGRQIRELEQAEEPRSNATRWNEIVLQLDSIAKDGISNEFLQKSIAGVNASPETLTGLLGRQYYKLSNWRVTDKEITFRRFFTVNGLICLNIQHEEVFEEYHRLLLQLVEEKVFTGLRIDHIDGLYDPAGYLAKLREKAGADTYIVAEKILEKTEDMPHEWPLQGATGYEFLAAVNNVLTNASAEEAFTDFYQQLTGENTPVHEQLHAKKKEILYEHMGGELQNLTHLFVKLRLADESETDVNTLREAIAEFLIHFPVYRFYGNTMPLSANEEELLKAHFDNIKQAAPGATNAIELLEKCLLETTKEDDEDYQARAGEFYSRLMQFTGPLMAKGGEDTLMYTFNRFVGHNEVGDFPDRFGMSVKAFHSYMRNRQRHWPLALNATSTHDTKRGEDVRARLNVLTDLGGYWLETVGKWLKNNPTDAPDANDQFLIYQNLIGAHPMPGADGDDFPKRVGEYLTKALREAKVNSGWAEPNEAYEQKTLAFASGLLQPDKPFYKEFSAFLEEIVDFGIINSLSQVVLKFTCPGVPDVYQGCELWDLSLVDPDNRRPVDYELRQQMLDSFSGKSPDELIDRLWADRYSGSIKLWLTQQLFALRKSEPSLFTSGEYMPLKVKGEYKEHVLAFGRKEKNKISIVALPLHTAVLCREQGTDFFGLDWKDTTIVLPERVSNEWINSLSGQKRQCAGKLLPGEIFEKLPVAILAGSQLENPRTAGLLLHISSLPSAFGIGDLGPEAYAFADFLASSGQRLWQLLPLNPTEPAQANSPYSALSSMAGNELLISPEKLGQEGLLTMEILEKYQTEATDKTDYDQAAKVKSELLQLAFEHYQQNQSENDRGEFDAFCKRNEAWLDDFAVYMVLKKRFDGNPWYQWPAEFRSREAAVLQQVHDEQAEDILYQKWIQYEFDRQWKELREYCNIRDIKMFGDIPFYVSYDSADVWANRSIFCVDDDGKITGVAGVPPDAFSDDGQLWGMPVFNWAAVKEQDYQWWIDRLKKNVELFDIVRLDHFRAFEDFWEVPGGEKTAVNGKWKPGPGSEFFKKISAALGGLPFVAEDLGEITPEVYRLRDEFELPGMKVLQFAFGDSMSESDHIPHHFTTNFFAYTGTHDNNTTRGWFAEIAPDGGDERLSAYVGREVSEKNASLELIRMLYSSVARAAIMPVQDVLNLDASAKMNMPGSSEDNWAWRLLPGQLDESHATFLRELTVLYNRG